ncbi:MAG: autotransporter-associated beta strand repeat-containing protein [Verrucomicrobiae bacterium]|nr:autotransporter-associated beta strand repeat-containing protein [Verrucomicrobiae bacterium]
MGANRTATISGGTLTLGGAIDDGAASRSLTKAGAGALVLNGLNTFDGQVLINQGILSVNTISNAGSASGLGDATGANSVIRMGNNTTTGTLRYTGAGDATDRQVQIGSGTVGQAGGATIDASGANGGTGLKFTNTSFNAAYATATGARTLTLTGSNTDTNEIQGIIADNNTGLGGTVAVLKSDVGLWLLSGTNTYPGNTTVREGTLALGANDVIPGALVMGNNNGGTATFDLAGHTNTMTGANALQLGLNATTVGGATHDVIDSVGGGLLKLAGDVKYEQGSLGLRNAQATISADLDLNGATRTFNIENATVTDDVVVVGTITNSGGSPAGITKTGAGSKLVLSGANTYDGATTITAGTLELQNASAAGTGTIILDGGTLQLARNGGTVFGNDIAVSNSSTLTVARLATGNAVTHTFSDFTLADGVTLTVSQDGTLFNNNQGYTIRGNDLTLLGDGTLDIREGKGSADGTLTVTNVLAGGAGQDLIVKGNDPNQSQLYVYGALQVGGDLTVGTNALVRTADGATNVAGNINLLGGVLGVNTNFARQLGTGAGQVQLTGDSTFQSGFSAYDNPIVVRIEDGSNNLTNLIWGTATFNPGILLLNQDDANTNIVLQNSIDLNVVGAGVTNTRQINAHNSVAAIAGAITNSGDGVANFTKSGAGTLSLEGPLGWNGETRILNGGLRLTNANQLPSGNLAITPDNAAAALETQGIFTNALGAGPGQVQIVGTGTGTENSRAGFSARGGDLTIDIGGDGTGTGGQLQWNSTYFDPNGAVTNSGALLLNRTVADGTLYFLNDMDLNGEANTPYRRFEVNASTAVLSGDLTNGGATAIGIQKLGDGTLILSGTNSYDGGTLISSGALRAQNNSALGTTAAGTVVSTNEAAALELAGGITIGPETLTMGGSGISGTGALRNISGSNVFGGDVLLMGNTTFGADAGTLTLDGATIGADTTGNRGVTFTGAGDFVVNSLITNVGDGALTKLGTGTLTLVGGSLHGGNTVIRDGTLKLGADNVLPTESTYVANQTGGSATLDVAGRTDAIGALVIGQTATGAGSSNNVIDSVGGGLLRLGGTVTYSIGSAGFTNAGSTISANVDLNNATRTFAVNDSALADLDLAITGSITNSGATAAGITKTGLGTLALGGTEANTYNGNTTISAGMVLLNKSAGVNAIAGNIVIGDGATTPGLDILALNQNNQIDDSSLLTFNGTGGDAGVFALNGFNETVTGIVSTAGAGVIVNGGAANSTLTVNDGNVNRAYSGEIHDGPGAGSLALVKRGGGTLTLSGSNSFSGGTTIAGGELRASHNSALGIGGVLVTNSGAMLELSEGITLNNALTIGNPGNAKTLRTVAGVTNAEYAGTITIQETTHGNFIVNAQNDFGTLLISGAIGGSAAGGVTKGGPGTVVLSASNSYTGKTTINAGALSISNENALGSNPASFAADQLKLNGGTLRMTEDMSIDDANRGIMVSNGTFEVVANRTAAIENVITGSGLNKAGAGILALNAANTYSGLTEIAAGALRVNGSHFGGDGYTVYDGAVLGGTGIIGSAVLVQSNAVMAPGNSIGTFTTTNNFTFSAGGVLQIELDGAGLGSSDILAVSGALDIAGASVTFTNIGSALDDDAYIFAQYGSLVGIEFLDVFALPGGYIIDYNYLGGNQIALVIPEPAPLFVLLLGALGLTLWARRGRMGSVKGEEK